MAYTETTNCGGCSGCVSCKILYAKDYISGKGAGRSKYIYGISNMFPMEKIQHAVDLANAQVLELMPDACEIALCLRIEASKGENGICLSNCECKLLDNLKNAVRDWADYHYFAQPPNWIAYVAGTSQFISHNKFLAKIDPHGVCEDFYIKHIIKESGCLSCVDEEVLSCTIKEIVCCCPCTGRLSTQKVLVYSDGTIQHMGHAPHSPRYPRNPPAREVDTSGLDFSF